MPNRPAKKSLLNKKDQEKHDQMKERFDRLHALEDELGCFFKPMIMRTAEGSQTYILPVDKPEEPKEKPKVKRK